ncbi:MAG: hypothetical protein JWO36_730 [Myxococcales bacterium]|nr:hypothetical protein [Myxococcales bacterium]
MRMEETTGSLRLTGQVVDEQKLAVPDALVRLMPGDRTVITDAHGTFEFDRLSSRRYWFSANKDDFYAGPTVVRAVEGAEPVLLQMHRGATLVIHVTANGAPVAGAGLFIDKVLTATTNHDGTATIRGLSPAYHDGWVTAEGWAPAFVFALFHENPGGVTERFVTLCEGARIEGVVLGPGDIAVADASVVLWRVADSSFVGGATSGADGRWRIDALEAGTFRVVASSEEYCSNVEMILECDGQTSQLAVAVRVEHGAEVHGSVVDTTGTPVSGAQINAMLYHASSKRSVSDESGSFRIAGLPPGEYYVDAVTPTHASAAAHLQLERGKPVETQLVLEPARVAGVVVGEDGEPVVEAIVRAIACTGYVPYRLEASTDSRGHFDLGPLQLGEYDLYASWPGLRSGHEESATARVRSSDTDVRLVPESPSGITGRVFLDGTPLQYFGASLVHEREMPGGRAVGIRDSDGRFMLRAEPGTWRLALLGPGTKLKIIGDITAERSKVVDVGDIAMERGQRITGRVRDAAGAPVAGARVKIGRGADLHANTSRLRQWFEGEYETNTDHDGWYVFDGVGQPEWVRVPPLIAAIHPAVGASHVRSLPDGDATVDFVLLGSGTIDGFVEGAQGRHRFVEAVAEGEPKRARWMSVNRAGEFRFENVPPGECIISLSGMGDGVIASEKVVVASGQRTKVKLVMTSSTVWLTIRVPRGREKELRIERADGNAEKPVSDATMIMDGQITFSEVEPGEYRVSLDGTTWTPISVVPGDPPEQTVMLSS